jgi:hypothetical protein
MMHLHLIPYTVTDLDFSSCGLGPIGIKRVCDFLKSNNQSITTMYMCHNRIGAGEGVKEVADMMKVNNTVSKLIIQSCQINAVDCYHLSKGLAQNTGLLSFCTLEALLSGSPMRMFKTCVQDWLLTRALNISTFVVVAVLLRRRVWAIWNRLYERMLT